MSVDERWIGIFLCVSLPTPPEELQGHESVESFFSLFFFFEM